MREVHALTSEQDLQTCSTAAVAMTPRRQLGPPEPAIVRTPTSESDPSRPRQHDSPRTRSVAQVAAVQRQPTSAAAGKFKVAVLGEHESIL